MTISVTALTWLVVTATIVSAVAPIVLLAIWFKDWSGGKLW